MYRIRIKGKGLPRAQYQNSQVDDEIPVFKPFNTGVDDDVYSKDFDKERENQRRAVEEFDKAQEKQQDLSLLGTKQDDVDLKYQSSPAFQAKYDFSLIGAQDNKKQQRQYNNFLQEKYDPNYKKRRNARLISSGINLGLSGASAAVDYFTDKKKQKDWDKWFRSQSLPDNMYAVGAGDRGDFDINEGIYQPNNLTPPNPGAFYSARYGGTQPTNSSMNLIKIKLKSSPESMKYGGQNRTGMSLGLDLGSRNVYRDMPKEKSEHVRDVIPESPRDKANIEAELGETVYGDLDGDGSLEHMKIGGKRHTEGGTPLNVPEGSFVFSDTKKMIIKDPVILERFGMKPRKEGYTPAEIAKKYDINKYKAIMEDPNVDSVRKSTAQLMIKNFQKKLAELALIQEGMKGFPQGVPLVARQTLPEAEQLAQSMEQEKAMERGPSVEQQEGMAPPMGEQPYPEDEQMMEQEQMAAMEQPQEGQEEPMMRHGGGYMNMYQGSSGPSTVTRQPVFTPDYQNIASGTDYDVTLPINATDASNADRFTMPSVQLTRTGQTRVYGDENWVDPEHISDFVQRHADFIKQNPGWDPTKVGDTEKFQKWYNKKAQEQGLPAYFIEGDSIRGADDMFGEYTYSAPSLTRKTQPGTVPGFICINGKVESKTYASEAERNAAGAKANAADAAINCSPSTTPNTIDVNNKTIPSRMRSRWMTPDKVNMLAAAAVPPKKYLPYAAKAEYEPNRLSLEDWRAQAAAEQSMYNKQGELMGVYGPTTGQGANQSFAAGQQAERVGNVISGVTSRNVDRVNQFLAQERARKDQFNLLGAERTTNLFDKNVIANQQYDNARRQYLNNMAKTYGQGWQNAMKLGMLNAVNPRFKVNPLSGDTFFTGLGYGTNRLGSNTSGYTLDDFSKLKAQNIARGMSDAVAEQQALKTINASSSNSSNDNGQSWLPNYNFDFGLFGS